MTRNTKKTKKKVFLIIIDWKTIVSWRNKCAIYDSMESTFDLNDYIKKGTSTHLNLYILLKEHLLCL